MGCADAPTDGGPLPVQHIGLGDRRASDPALAAQTSGPPPLGEAIAPISGGPGDGAAVVTQVGGWSGGPGAVRWHGGQWVMPYSINPGSTLQNVSCDVWNPTTSAPASVLVEVVSSNGQVLGSATAPASTSVTFRLWPFLGTHAVLDGEQLAVRLSAKDATTGAWTTAAQDVTVINCAVRSTAAAIVAATINIPVTPAPAGAGFAANGFAGTSWGVNTSTADDGVVLPVHGVPVGATITAVRAKLSDSTAAPATVVLQAKEMPGLAAPVWSNKGSSASAGTGTIQLVQFSPGYLVPASTEMILVVHGVSVAPLRVYMAELDYQ